MCSASPPVCDARNCARQFPRGLLQIGVAYDGIAAIDPLRPVPGIFMATERETPWRSRLRTAVRRKSCAMRPPSAAPIRRRTFCNAVFAEPCNLSSRSFCRFNRRGPCVRVEKMFIKEHHRSDSEVRQCPTGSTLTGTPSARSVSCPSWIPTRAHSSANNGYTEPAGPRHFRAASAGHRAGHETRCLTSRGFEHKCARRSEGENCRRGRLIAPGAAAGSGLPARFATFSSRRTSWKSRSSSPTTAARPDWRRITSIRGASQRGRPVTRSP